MLSYRALLPLSLVLGLTVAPAAGAQTGNTTPTVSVGGVLFPQFRYGGDVTERSDNRFELERAYVNVRARLSHGFSTRVTIDVFQQRDADRADFYRGWVMRAKYAWLQYDFLRGDSTPLGLEAYAKLGLINTVIIEQVEEFWPRWISNVPTDRHGFFSSADAGLGVSVSIPRELGEIYATVTSGPGYQSPERDRFKDYAARLSLTPFAAGQGPLRTLTISPWVYQGARASDFAEGPGTVGPIAESRERDRWGVFLGLRDPRLTAGAEYARREDVRESADTLSDLVPTVREVPGRILSGFVLAKPFAMLDTATTIPVGVVLRYDRVTPDLDAEAYYNFIIAGLVWDVTRHVSLALDYQEQTPHAGAAVPDTRTYFLHAVARF